MSEEIELGNNIFLSEENNYLTNKNIKLSIGEKEKRLLSYFLQHPNIELTKQELINTIWEHRAATIDDANLTQLIYKVRRDLSTVDMKSCIKTIPGKGYVYIPKKVKKTKLSPAPISNKTAFIIYSSLVIIISVIMLCIILSSLYQP
ncbi:winged helix-turn-helix domain-containing protein [Erwinia psidii]|uniref:Helix-turn-helix domain-containing protein n=1 Tax=Erwinia psidii TaxID=69224 RepID=A0A3N6SJ86_9GAMM|nr:helix-turn-helix domain-containing protein [Erwinia psidii]MCX8958449.1 helix-turn-helix domain-containing protein [Erwinia psidii]MCX8961041.1 helix-turn-helix domain-containing protein [Erwinia psidii]MCX8965531.1 helix-turn-helix domain-containing protein [Erwinia psidii]RQM38841.1 helix-turn-helix domain-containing protein [Erwinia psidii]